MISRWSMTETAQVCRGLIFSLPLPSSLTSTSFANGVGDSFLPLLLYPPPLHLMEFHGRREGWSPSINPPSDPPCDLINRWTIWPIERLIICGSHACHIRVSKEPLKLYIYIMAKHSVWECRYAYFSCVTLSSCSFILNMYALNCWLILEHYIFICIYLNNYIQI